MALERISELCDKLYHPKNSICRMYMARWYKDSKGWAESVVLRETGEDIRILRMKYILNHMCPNLAHLLPKPVNSHSVYNYTEATRYEFENTQMRVIDCNDVVISHGIERTVDEWKYLLYAICPLVCRAMNIDFDTFFSLEGISVPLSGEAEAVFIKYENKFSELTGLEN